VGIRLAPAEIDAVLDRAMRDARDSGRVPAEPLWTGRIEWLSERIASGDAQGKTYVAAVGAALLAKATDSQVDTLAQSQKGGPRGYSLRSVAERMQQRVRGTAHLGTLSRWPLNNAPFLRGPARIEQFVVAGYMRPVYEEFKAWMTELDGYAEQQAYDALVAFLRVRMAAQQAEEAAYAALPAVQAGGRTAELLDVLQLWIREDSEHGARGQALVAGVMSLAWSDVEVVAKHNAAPFDVCAPAAGIACECKQAPITSGDVMELARRAAAEDMSAAIYAALAVNQPPLPGDRLRTDALTTHGVMLDVAQDVRELTARVCIYGAVPPDRVPADLPGAVSARCRDADVPATGMSRLHELLRATFGP
jgi:hypothetical protein